jgi:probable F420-dependent oxidoreductase
MNMLGLGPVGVALNVSDDETYLAEAADVERLGYSTIWMPGGQIDSLARLADLVRATTTIGVASGVISPDVYSANAVCTFYAELPAAVTRRVIVGLGGPQKPRSLTALNTYLDILDRGVPPVPADRRILAALGPRKLELARERCAGAVTLLVTPAYTAAARRILGEAAALVVDQMLVLDTDATRARESARRPLRFLSGVRGYLANFERMGFSASEIAELSDRLVDDLVVWGNADTIAARVTEHLDAGADQVVLSALNDGGQPGATDVAHQLADKLLT